MKVADAANRLLLTSQITKALAQNIDPPILWTSLPTAQPLVGQLGERAVVYYCGDDFGALSGVDHEAVEHYEERLVERCDLVLAASERLAEKFPADRTRLLPHGVDLELFSQTAGRSVHLPKGEKIAGFYGSFSEWIDVDLLVRTAKTLTDWVFVFVGPVHTYAGELKALKNVTFVGEQTHSALPGFAQHWNVSLLPFRDNAQIRACNPLKLREYLAAGTPIVATEFPALEPYREFISTACSAEDFAQAIRRAGDEVPRREARSASVSKESWDQRATDVATALQAL